MSALDSLETPPALTALSEDEKFFQTTVRNFAREQIGPSCVRWTRPASFARTSSNSSSSWA